MFSKSLYSRRTISRWKGIAVTLTFKFPIRVSFLLEFSHLNQIFHHLNQTWEYSAILMGTKPPNNPFVFSIHLSTVRDWNFLREHYVRSMDVSGISTQTTCVKITLLLSTRRKAGRSFRNPWLEAISL